MLIHIYGITSIRGFNSRIFLKIVYMWFHSKAGTTHSTAREKTSILTYMSLLSPNWVLSHTFHCWWWRKRKKKCGNVLDYWRKYQRRSFLMSQWPHSLHSHCTKRKKQSQWKAIEYWTSGSEDVGLNPSSTTYVR